MDGRPPIYPLLRGGDSNRSVSLSVIPYLVVAFKLAYDIKSGGEKEEREVGKERGEREVSEDGKRREEGGCGRKTPLADVLDSISRASEQSSFSTVEFLPSPSFSSPLSSLLSHDTPLPSFQEWLSNFTSSSPLSSSLLAPLGRPWSLQEFCVYGDEKEREKSERELEREGIRSFLSVSRTYFSYGGMKKAYAGQKAEELLVSLSENLEKKDEEKRERMGMGKDGKDKGEETGGKEQEEASNPKQILSSLSVPSTSFSFLTSSSSSSSTLSPSPSSAPPPKYVVYQKEKNPVFHTKMNVFMYILAEYADVPLDALHQKVCELERRVLLCVKWRERERTGI